MNKPMSESLSFLPPHPKMELLSKSDSYKSFSLLKCYDLVIERITVQ